MQASHASTNSGASKRLWDRFAEMFGARFYDQFGTEPSESWKSAVSELRNDQVKAALAKVRNGGSQYPPSLPEFIALARNVKAPQEQPKPAMQLDDFTAFANRRLFEYLRLCGGVSEVQLPRLVAEKNRLAQQFREVDTEETVTETEFAAALKKAWDRITT